MSENKNQNGGGKQVTLQPEEARADSRPSEIIIEIDTGKSQDVMFDPIKEVLRGRYGGEFQLSGRIANQDERCRKLMGLTHIPGMHIALDIERKRGRVYDPLSLPKNKELAEKTFAAMADLRQGQLFKAMPEQVFEDMNNDMVATWAHWMGRLVHGHKATYVQGTLPRKPSEIGRVKVDFFDAHPGNPKYLDQFQSFQSA